LEDAENGLSVQLRRLLDGLWCDLVALDARVRELDDEVEAIAKAHPVAQRLQQLRGVGPLTATALIAAVGSGEQFAKGRDLAVSLGLTPKQHSTGGKERLLGISKRGDPYLRSLLVHGGRAALYAARDKDDRLSLWAKSLAARSHPNVAAVAWANKTARIAWAMIRHGSDYQPERATN
jgi:transposase